MEQIALVIVDVVELGVIDNHFTYQGRPGHEVVFVFDASFVDKTVLAQDAIPYREPGRRAAAQWIDLNKQLPAPVYPRGLLDLISGAQLGR